MRSNHFKRTILGVTAVSMLFAGSAFTASNTGIEKHAAGIGAATVTGVDVTSIAYVLDVTRVNVVEVNFKHTNDDVTDAVAEVQLASDGAWYTGCEVTNATYTTATDGTKTLSAEGTIVCDTTASTQTLAGAKNLTLVVGDNLTARTA